jgi:hypothetical protein
MTNQFPINLSNSNEPIFLCDWDSNSIVELHTRQSLKDKYGSTNLYDPEEQDFFIDDVGMTFPEYLDYMSSGSYHIFDNLRIERIN